MKIKTTIISVTIISTYVYFAIFLDLYQLSVSFPVLGIYCNLRQTKIKLKKETTTILKNQKNKCGPRNLF